ncbi:MAG: response regulator [Planctomycetales bacterium]|nr:response regulator [Planctomycetales bacterium]
MPSRTRILLVDDNPQDRRLVLREIRRGRPDAVVVEVFDRQGLDLTLSSQRFDLVITDYHLQWSDGLHVVKKVKRLDAHCPVIMFTGTGNEEVAVQAMKEGLDDYIIKNVRHLVRLRGAIEAALEHAAERRRAANLAKRLEGLLASLNVGAFRCTSEGQVVDFNAPLANMLSSSPSERVHPALEARLSSLAAQLTSDAPSSGDVNERELVFQSDNGEPRILRISLMRIDDEGSACIEGLVQDVTLQRRLEQERRQADVAAAQIAMLSPRESEVLLRVAAGEPNKVIARRLDIAEKTVEKHRANLMRKTSARSVADLVRLVMAAQHGEER